MDELRKKMVNDIAHNLRTPLTNINGYLEALSRGVISGDRELYQSLHEEALHMTNLVEQLHQLNVWESRKISTLDTEEMLIETVIEASTRSFSLEFESKNIVCEISPQSTRIKGNRDGLRQVMDNLIKNAVNYNEVGWIKIKGEPEGNMYRVAIANIGRPIPKDKSEKIFERFYRPELPDNYESEGSGLGLAIVKEIMELHGGWAGLSSKENQHTFWFTVPL
ncbi:MAG: sensor histidine kinase [Clostridia bacterium]